MCDHSRGYHSNTTHARRTRRPAASVCYPNELCSQIASSTRRGCLHAMQSRMYVVGGGGGNACWQLCQPSYVPPRHCAVPFCLLSLQASYLRILVHPMITSRSTRLPSLLSLAKFTMTTDHTKLIGGGSRSSGACKPFVVQHNRLLTLRDSSNARYLLRASQNVCYAQGD
jgi:hypothetical protein